MSRNIVYLITAVLISAGVYFFFFHRERAKLSTNMKSDNDIAIYTFTEVLIQGGRERGRLTASALVRNKKNGMVSIKSPRLQYYQGDTNVALLKAGSAIWDNNAQIIEAENNVTVTDSEGILITTQKLSWNMKKKLLTGDTDFVIVKGNSRLKGSSFKGMTEQKKYIVKNASGSFLINSN